MEKSQKALEVGDDLVDFFEYLFPLLLPSWRNVSFEHGADFKHLPRRRIPLQPT